MKGKFPKSQTHYNPMYYLSLSFRERERERERESSIHTIRNPDFWLLIVGLSRGSRMVFGVYFLFVLREARCAISFSSQDFSSREGIFYSYLQLQYQYFSLASRCMFDVVLSWSSGKWQVAGLKQTPVNAGYINNIKTLNNRGACLWAKKNYGL